MCQKQPLWRPTFTFEGCLLRLVLAFFCGWSALSQAATLPDRLLLVSWRSIDSGAVAAMATPGSNWATDVASDMHSLSVRNGGSAQLWVTHRLSQQTWQWTGVLSPSAPASPASAQVLSGTQSLDWGSGVAVRVQWPGGKAPVQLTLQAQSSQVAGLGVAAGAAPDLAARGAHEPDGQLRHTLVQSTMVVPLGQWVTVAQSGPLAAAGAVPRSGRWATQDAEAQRQFQIRVTLP